MTNQKNVCVIVALLITGGSDKLLLSHLSTLAQNGYNVYLYSIRPMNNISILSDKFRDCDIVLKDYSMLIKLLLQAVKYALSVPIYSLLILANLFGIYRKPISKEKVLVSIENRIIFQMCMALLFLRIIIDNFFHNFNIISSYHYSTYGISYYLQKSFNIPSIYTEISSPQFRKNWMPRLKMSKYLNSFSKIFVPSKIIGDELREYEGLNKDYIISPFIIEELPYSFVPSSRNAESFGVIARLSPQKNQDILIKVLRIIVKSKPNAQLVLIGRGEEESRYKSLVKELHLENNAQFIPGFGLITEVIDKIDIFVLCSDVEGMPLVLLEALYYSKPILVNDVGSTSELVINNFNGFIIDKNNLDDIASKILLIMDDVNLFNKLSMNSRNLYNNKYKPATILYGMLAEYNRLT
ncbi:glycosyltransferase [uncultured Methanomethylovorans sp.]|uniref:glycosyltransferase n=1 Tax=uncultured Methanomethylovorans sp. TaxID=183759 RepID=UPI003749162E